MGTAAVRKLSSKQWLKFANGVIIYAHKSILKLSLLFLSEPDVILRERGIAATQESWTHSVTSSVQGPQLLQHERVGGSRDPSLL